MSTPVIFKEFTVAMQGIPGNGQVFVKTRVGAGLANDIITFTQPLVDNAGVVLTGDFILGLRIVKGDDINYVEQVRVPANGMSTDGITASNCIRGLDKDSMVFDVGNEANAVELPQDSIVEFVYSIQERTMVAKFITGIIGSGGDDFDVGTRGGNTVVYKFDNVPMIRRVVTSALLTGDTGAESNFATWAAVIDGSFRITVDGVAVNVDGIDFTGDTDMDDVAATIQTALRATTSGNETVTFSVNRFIISSGISTPTSAITVTTTSTGTVGTDISGAGAADWLDADTGNGVVTNFTSFIEFSDDGISFAKMSTIGAHGTLADLKNHQDVAASVTDSPADEDLFTFDLGLGDWKNKTILAVLGATKIEITQLTGTTNIGEADIFFGVSNMTGAESNTLRAGPSSNADALHTHLRKINITTTPVTVSNTTSETNLLSVSIPENRLSTNNGVVARLNISDHDELSGTMTIRAKYGGTTVSTLVTTGAALTNMKGFIEFRLYANAATNAQKGFANCFLVADAGATFGNVKVFADEGTAAEDSTGDLDLVISVQFSVANAGNSITMDTADIQFIS